MSNLVDNIGLRKNDAIKDLKGQVDFLKESSDFIVSKDKKDFKKGYKEALDNLRLEKDKKNDLEKEIEGLREEIKKSEKEFQIDKEKIEEFKDNFPEEASLATKHLNALIKENSDIIDTLNKKIEDDQQSIKEVEENIKNKEIVIDDIKNKRKAHIDKKITEIKQNYGLETLNETKKNLSEKLEDINESLVGIEKSIEKFQSGINAFPDGSEGKRVYGEKLNDAEKKLKEAIANKDTLRKQLSKIENRIDQINNKVNKWEGLKINEGLELNTPKEELVPDQAVNNIDDGSPFTETSSVSLDTKDTNPGESGITGIISDILGDSSGTNEGGEPRENIPVEKKEIASNPEEKFKEAKTLNEIKEVIDSLDENDEFFSKSGRTKEELQSALMVLLKIKPLETADAGILPKTDGLRENIIRIIDEENNNSFVGNYSI